MKKILLFLFIFFFSFSFVKAEEIENIFKDIDKNYIYYNELQTFYDRGIIFPDEKGNFNPKSYLTRDEFVWIVSEISCKDCIKPNTDFSLVEKYNSKKIFFDISENDKYFYCIADSNSSWEVTGYQEWTACQNWVSKAGERPFCPENNILLEEALAIILRNWNILSNAEAEKIRLEIQTGKHFQNILNISPKLSNGGVYSFYPDFKKAYEYTFLDFDKDWNEKKLKLLDFSKNINPKQFVTKEDFLRIAYIALKNNSCKPNKENNFWLKIEILEKTCVENQKNCKITDFPKWEKVFDFRWTPSKTEVNLVYNWRFYDYSTWKYIFKTWKYIDNYNFLKDWKYRVYLTVFDKNWEKSEVFSDLKIQWWNFNEKDFYAKIEVNKNFLNPWEKINLVWKSNWVWVKYSWDFWDGKDYNWQIVGYNFPKKWSYDVKLTVENSQWEKRTTTEKIYVWEKTPPKIDWLTSFIIVDKIEVKKWDFINFVWVSNKWNFVNYVWDFWDWSDWDWEKIKHRFWNNWTYTITLTVKDYLWNISTSNVNIKITWNNWFDKNLPDSDDDGVPDEKDFEKNTPKDKIKYICTSEFIEKKLYSCRENDLWVYKKIIELNWKNDVDWDGVDDNQDRCIFIKWEKENFWCPIFEEKCKFDANCKNWFFCDNWYCKPKKYTQNCAYDGGDIITWNLECNSCPCDYNLDFNAKLRACDIIFPAISSPDKKDIFSKWKYFQIQK